MSIEAHRFSTVAALLFGKESLDVLIDLMRMASRYSSLVMPVSGSGKQLKDLMLRTDNRICADCGAPDPKWASANIGVFICVKCCEVHRSLGMHISKVLSVTLDDWSEAEIESMIEVGGNSFANSIYEAYIPKGYLKPSPDSTHEERLSFIRAKYELQEFLKPSLRIVSLTKTNPTTTGSIPSFADQAASKKMVAGMVDFIGLLKVKVIKGTNLAIRDMLTSDPYVVLTLGQQKVQTSVKSSNLNPVWNEELMLYVPEEYKPLKLQVFDYDTFTSDDIMGEAEVDLQPLITAALALEGLSLFGDMQIGKWFKTHDNALLEDSFIRLINGKIKQGLSLKLQNVECGELQLELEWMPLDQ